MQRVNFRNIKKGAKNSSLTPDKINLLVAIGFTFQSRDLNFTWQERAEQWKEFYNVHGRDPKRAENSNLQAWCQNIRRKYADVQRGLKESVPWTQEQTQLLNDWGFKWEYAHKAPVFQVAQVKSWEQRFQDLVEYQEYYGDFAPPKEDDLGRWVCEQRKQYRAFMRGEQGKISQEKIAKLLEIGFLF
jgi:hypothetical protein